MCDPKRMGYDFANGCNFLSWFLITCPDPELRSASDALRWARKAVEIDPTDSNLQNTLGIAHYRAGNWQDAINALRKAEELNPHDYFGFNAFFLSMAYWQIGQQEEARRWYDQGVAWLDEFAVARISKGEIDELQRFRDEAATLLKVSTGEQ